MKVNIDDSLKEQGVHTSVKKRKLSFDEIRFNLFAYLEDYSKMGFSFVKAGNELLEIRKDLDRYTLFGQCFLGYFVISQKNQIFLICNPEGIEVFQKPRIFVNHSLQAFVSSYSLFMSAVFLLKSKFYKSQAYQAEEIATDLMNKVADLEEPIEQELTFWEHIAYLIEDDGIVLRDDLFHILNKGY